jgi:L-fucose isomerase-like protein
MLGARFGVSIVPVPLENVREAMQGTSPSDVERLRRESIARFPLPSAVALLLEPGLRLHLALARIAAEQRIDGFAVECWTGLPQALGLNPCLGFIDDTYTLACEGDVELAIGLLAVRLATGSSPYAGDLYDCDPAGIVTLVHCGGPASLAAGAGDVVIGMSRMAEERGFQTVTCRPQLAPRPVTLLRLSGAGCESMHVAAGRLVSCETNPDLRIRVALAGSRWDFLDHCHGNHYISAAGDIRPELRLLAEWYHMTADET